MSDFKILGREPALVIGFVSALLVFLGTQNLPGLSPEHAALWIAAINAIAGAITALTVRPVPPAAFTNLVGAVVALASGYGLEMSTEAVGALNAVVIAGLTLILRGQVEPQNTKLSRNGFAKAA